MGVDSGHARPIALDRESRVEVVRELGPHDHPVAADDDGRYPGRGGLVAEVLEDAAQDDRSPLVPRRACTVDPRECTVLAIDHGTGTKVEPGELASSPHGL